MAELVTETQTYINIYWIARYQQRAKYNVFYEIYRILKVIYHARLLYLSLV